MLASLAGPRSNTISLLLRETDLEPDVVLLYQSLNDLQPAAHRPFDPEYAFGHADVHVEALGFDIPPPGPIGRSLLIERLRGPRSFGPQPGRPTAAAPDPQASATFRRNVEAFVAIAERAGATAVLATQPMRVRPDHAAADLAYLEGWLRLEGASVEAALADYNQVLRSVAAARGLPLIDVANEAGFVDEDFVDPLHYSEAGSQRLASYVARRLAELELVVPRTAQQP